MAGLSQVVASGDQDVRGSPVLLKTLRNSTILLKPLDFHFLIPGYRATERTQHEICITPSLPVLN